MASCARALPSPLWERAGIGVSPRAASKQHRRYPARPTEAEVVGALNPCVTCHSLNVDREQMLKVVAPKSDELSTCREARC